MAKNGTNRGGYTSANKYTREKMNFVDPRTLQIERQVAQNHTNHRTTSQRLHRVLCIVFSFMCVAEHASALVVCAKRRIRKTILLSETDRQTKTDKLLRYHRHDY